MNGNFASRCAARFHAFADAFALGFQILQQLLPRKQSRSMLLRRPKLLADLRDLLAQLPPPPPLGLQLRLLLRPICPSLHPASAASSARCRFQRLQFSRPPPAAARASRVCCAAIFFRSISIAPSRLLICRQLPHQIQNRRLVLLDLLIDLLQLKLPIAKRLLPLLDQPPMLFKFAVSRSSAARLRLQRLAHFRQLRRSSPARSCSNCVNLLGHLLQLLRAHTAAAAAPIASPPCACTSSYSSLLPLSAKALQILSLARQLILLPRQIPRRIIQPELRICLRLLDSSSASCSRCV